MNARRPVFRVHFFGGRTIDIEAENPNEARSAANQRRPGAIITKIKVVKESGDASTRQKGP